MFNTFLLRIIVFRHLIIVNKTLIFFYKLKSESSLHVCVKFYSSRVCRTHKNFQLFINFLLKISFFAKFVCFV